MTLLIVMSQLDHPLRRCTMRTLLGFAHYCSTGFQCLLLPRNQGEPLPLPHFLIVLLCIKYNLAVHVDPFPTLLNFYLHPHHVLCHIFPSRCHTVIPGISQCNLQKALSALLALNLLNTPLWN